MTTQDLQIELRGAVAWCGSPAPPSATRSTTPSFSPSATRSWACPDSVRAAVLDGDGEHFCAGLDLSELKERDAGQGLHHSRMWHAALEEVQYGRVPVVAALHGAVVGGGLELASACHIRVADETTFYALPEGSRGIFVGGGGAVRIPRLIGVARMTDMMLTGRVYDAAGRRARRLRAVPGARRARRWRKALELAERVAENAPLTNYALMHALPRIAEQPADQGFLTEALMAAIAQSAPGGQGARARLPRRPRRQGRARAEPRRMSRHGAARYRPLHVRRHARACCATAPTACSYLRAEQAAGAACAERMTDRLLHWADDRARPRCSWPAASACADGSTGDWQRITYGAGAAGARAASARRCSTAASAPSGRWPS